MSRLYYNQRHNTEPIGYDITVEFWNSFSAYYQLLIRESMFVEKFGYPIENGDVYGFDGEKFSEAVLIQFGKGFDLTTQAFHKENMPEDKATLGLIEFLYDQISEAQTVFFNQCGYDEIRREFNKGKARYPYTIQINNLFKANRLGYHMQDGYIRKVRSDVLDNRLFYEDIRYDTKIKQLVKDAIREYQTPGSNTTYIGLNLIANALTRCTTLKNTNKKRSLEEIMQLVTERGDLRPYIDEHWKSLTKIANQCVIRHTEHDRIEIADQDIEEFLFYSFYNMIRLVLKKLDMIEESKC